MRDYFRNRQVLGSIRQLDVVVPDKIIIIDDFNSYTNGDLNGQGGWSGATNMKVQGTVTKEGIKAISSGAVGSASSVKKTFTPYGSGIYSIWIRQTANLTAGFAIFTNETTLVGLIYVSSGSVYFTSASQVNIGSISSNIWSKLEMESDTDNNRVRGRFNGGTWSDWQYITHSSINAVVFDRNTGSSGTSYYDLIEYINL